MRMISWMQLRSWQSMGKQWMVKQLLRNMRQLGTWLDGNWLMHLGWDKNSRRPCTTSRMDGLHSNLGFLLLHMTVPWVRSQGALLSIFLNVRSDWFILIKFLLLSITLNRSNWLILMKFLPLSRELLFFFLVRQCTMFESACNSYNQKLKTIKVPMGLNINKEVNAPHFIH
jgi:hypothetical protein